MTHRVVWVEWEDSMGASGWRCAPDIDRAMGDRELDHVSIGFVVDETAKSITITTSMGVEHALKGNVMDPLTIPKRAITRILDVDWV